MAIINADLTVVIPEDALHQNDLNTFWLSLANYESVTGRDVREQLQQGVFEGP